MAARLSKDSTHEYNARFWSWLYQHLRRHAHERDVYINELINDVLAIWVYTVTDPDDPVFSPDHMGIERAKLPPARYLGYLEGLGFNLSLEDLANVEDIRGIYHRPLSASPSEKIWTPD